MSPPVTIVIVGLAGQMGNSPILGPATRSLTLDGNCTWVLNPVSQQDCVSKMNCFVRPACVPQNPCFYLLPLFCALSTPAVIGVRLLRRFCRPFLRLDIGSILCLTLGPPLSPVGICHLFDICYSALYYKKSVRKCLGSGYGPEFPAGDPEQNSLTAPCGL